MNHSLNPLVFGVQIQRDSFGQPKHILLTRQFTINSENNEFLSSLLSECLQKEFVVVQNPVHIRINDKLKAIVELKKCGIKIIKKEEEAKPASPQI